MSELRNPGLNASIPSGNRTQGALAKWVSIIFPKG